MAPRFAGIGGHHSARAKTHEWLTPPSILAALGPFDLDPCAPAVRPWPTAARHFTRADNGLMLPWFGRVWLNPPYDTEQLGRWLARMAEHDHGTALIFARTETAAFFSWVWERAAAALFLRGRLNFCLPDGAVARKNSGAPSVLVAYGNEDAERLNSSCIDGRFVALAMPRIIAVILPDSAMSWRALLTEVLSTRSAARLDEIYVLVADHPKARRNRHWRDKVRQIVQRAPFRRIRRGVYSVEAA